LDHNHFFAFDSLRHHLLLLVRRQRSGVLRLVAHALNRIHHVFLLREERVAQIRGPLNVVRQTFHHVRQRRHRLNTRVPRLLLDCFSQLLLVFPKVRISLQPLL
jgi:hypothetical protein